MFFFQCFVLNCLMLGNSSLWRLEDVNLWYFIKGMFFLLRFMYEIFVINIVTRLEVIYVCNLDTSTNAQLKGVAMLWLQHVSAYDWPSIFQPMCLSIMNVRISIYSSKNGIIKCGLNMSDACPYPRQPHSSTLRLIRVLDLSSSTNWFPNPTWFHVLPIFFYYFFFLCN